MLRPTANTFNWRRITKVMELDHPAAINATVLEVISAARSHALGDNQGRSAYFGVTLADLLAAGLLQPGGELVLLGQNRKTLARAKVEADSQILWRGARYRTPSDKVFGALFGRPTGSLNGWTHWHADRDGAFVSLASLRNQLRPAGDPTAVAEDETTTGTTA